MEKFYTKYYENTIEYLKVKFPEAPQVTLEEVAAHMTNLTIITTIDSINDHYKLTDRRRFDKGACR